MASIEAAVKVSAAARRSLLGVVSPSSPRRSAAILATAARMPSLSRAVALAVASGFPSPGSNPGSRALTASAYWSPSGSMEPARITLTPSRREMSRAMFSSSRLPGWSCCAILCALAGEKTLMNAAPSMEMVRACSMAPSKASSPVLFSKSAITTENGSGSAAGFRRLASHQVPATIAITTAAVVTTMRRVSRLVTGSRLPSSSRRLRSASRSCEV